MRTYVTRLLSFGCLTLLAAGCGVGGRMDALKDDIGAGRVEGVAASDGVRWTWPESGPKQFGDVKPIRLYVYDGPNRGTWLYAIEGKDSATGRWRTLYLSKYAPNGQWQPLATGQQGPKVEAAAAVMAGN